MKTVLSVLDLAPVPAGGSAAEALRRTAELARLAELLGYVRYWFAEHHSMPSVASSAPEILIGHVAAATEKIRVGSGGIMLPNHPPLRVAENFRTLEALFPGRIDLGLGRAPGSEEAQAYPYSEDERVVVRDLRKRSIVGDPAAVRARIEQMARDAGADEVMVVSNMHGHAERMRSYELIAEAFSA